MGRTLRAIPESNLRLTRINGVEFQSERTQIRHSNTPKQGNRSRKKKNTCD
jgi:hypothetical protein